jgi:L-amino acid N-acyltransferase YncA
MNQAGLTIRRATPADYEAICELADQMDELFRTHLPDRFRKPTGPVRLRDRTEKLMNDPDTLLAVAELDGKVAGIMNCGFYKMADFPQKKALRHVLVRGISVRAELRRRGIGSALVRRALEWAKEKEVHEVQANVYDFNRPAAAFFASLGLAPLSHRLSLRLDA